MNGLQILAAAVTDTPDISTWSWATVTQTSPLRVKVDGEAAALAVTPDTLTGPLAVGTRVWVQLVTNADPARHARRLVILGAVGIESIARVVTETQNNTTTLTNDGVLFFTPPVGGGSRWEIEIWGAYSTSATGLFQCAFDVAAGNNMRWTIDAPSTADGTKPNWDYVFDNSAKSLGRFGTYNPMRIKGVYKATSTATLHFQWAQSVADAGPTFLLNDTFMRAKQIV